MWLTSVVAKHSARHDLVYLVEATDSRAAIFPMKPGRGGDPDLLAIGIFSVWRTESCYCYSAHRYPDLSIIFTSTHTERFMSFK